jgi:membrane protease YdiL (CAAX protease family)
MVKLTRFIDAVLHPEIRLKADFPWSFGKMAKTYVVASVFYLVGSLLPVFAFTAFLAVGVKYFPDLTGRIVTGPDGNSMNMALLVGLTVTSFIMGFGSELMYIRRVFHRDGLSLRQSMAFNLKSLGGSWWAVIWRVLAAFALVLVVDYLLDFLPLPKAHDPAAEFAHQLRGWSFFAFAVLAGVCAPFFEELVFRGFLFNVCRTSFRQGRLGKFFRNERFADYGAMLVSGVAFAAAHMSPTGFPALLVMGVVLAALYRRSGSLVCPILLHALNNITAVVLMYLSMK